MEAYKLLIAFNILIPHSISFSQAGEVLLEEEAVAAVLQLEFLASNCSMCLKAVVAATPCFSCSQV